MATCLTTVVGGTRGMFPVKYFNTGVLVKASGWPHVIQLWLGVHMACFL